MEQIFIKLHGSQSTQWAIIVCRKMKTIYFSLSLDSFTCISSLKNQLQVPKAYSLCSIIPKGNLFGIGSLCPSISPSSHTSIPAFSRETLLFENCGRSFSYEGFWVCLMKRSLEGKQPGSAVPGMTGQLPSQTGAQSTHWCHSHSLTANF